MRINKFKGIILVSFISLVLLAFHYKHAIASNGSISLDSDILSIDYNIDSSDIAQAHLQNPSCNISKYFIVVRLMNSDSLVVNTWTPDNTNQLNETHSLQKMQSFSNLINGSGLKNADRMQIFIQFMDQNNTCEVTVPQAYDSQTGDYILNIPSISFSQLPYNF